MSRDAPPRYQRTAAPFWDDPHIAAGMLAAHLDPSTDAASRRPAFIDASAAWIASLVPAGAHLLDLGCGPGLYGRRFSSLGLRVTGVDISGGSIAFARAHDRDGDYRVQDYLTMGFPARFDIATLIWCDYGALTDSERDDLLARVAAALRPGGLFVLDVFTPAWLAGRSEATTRADQPGGGFFSALPHEVVSTSYRYDDRVSLDRHVVVDAAGTRVHHVWNTCFTRDELAGEAAAVGFEFVDAYDDIAGARYTGCAETLAAVLRRV
ncbi:MAG: class I SAM-dependent methyltransferase [Propionicimonas sp.]